jgi:phospholipase C
MPRAMTAVSRASVGFVAAVCVLIALPSCGGGSNTASRSAPPVVTPTPTATPGRHTRFEHIIVVEQENRTVDNMFNGFAGAETVRTGNRFGQTVALQETPLEPTAWDLDHTHRGFVADYDDGKMDGFDHALQHSENTAYTYVRAPDVANYWTLASRFTLADHVFQMNMGPSFAAHVYLVAGQGGYPFAFAGNPNHKEGYGCFDGGRVAYLDMRTPFPGARAHGPACMDMPVIFDLLDKAGIAWRYYAADFGFSQRLWSAPDYIEHIAEGPDHANLVNPETQILSDIAGGTLPPVAYVVPRMCSSDHPHGGRASALLGPEWVASITNAIGKSQYWQSTLILVTWDDWGGFYDHIAPPIQNANTLGFRTPLLIVSAYAAQPGAVDHTVRSQGAILHAIESNFGLGSLGTLDAKSDDLRRNFNFSTAHAYGAPLPAATPPPSCRAKQGEDADTAAPGGEDDGDDAG